MVYENLPNNNPLGEPTERSPLISSHIEHETPTPRPRWWQSWEKVMLVVLAAVLLVSLGDQLQETPHTRLMESVICYRYFEKVDPSKLLLSRDQVGPGAIGGVSEMLCKADDVQSELAMLRGWYLTFAGFPSLILALPFGWAADRYGRKPFVLAGLVGFILAASWTELVLWFWQSFSVRAVWFSVIFGSVGGGNNVTVALLFVLLSDITPEAKRADAFLRVGAFNLLAQLVMPPLAAWLMKYNPWIPALGGTLLITTSALIFLLCPETMNFQSDPTMTAGITLTTQVAAEGRPASTTDKATLQDKVRHSLRTLKEASSFLLDDWRIPALIVPFLLHMVVGSISSLLLQYLSKRYGLTFSNATLLMAIRSGVIVLLLFIVLPYLSTILMRKYHLSGPRKDLYLVRASLAFIAVGFMFVGFSPNIPVVAISLALSALGQGFALVLRSFLTALVPSHHIARVYSIVSILETIGMMVGSPLLAGLFKRGLALGGAWIGLPFYFTALVSAMFLLLLLSIRLRKCEDGHVCLDEEEYDRVQ